MARQAEKHIEQLLRRSAEARRAQFGEAPSMPNPMRARLHDELDRINREPAPQPRKNWLSGIWPRVLIGAAVAALLVAAPTMFWYRSYQADQNARYAINERAAAPAAPPAVTMAESVPAPAAQAADALASTGGSVAQLNARDPAKLNQQFAQTPVGARSRGKLRSKKAANVLNTFRVEQDGSTIRVIDADGSTYTGTARVVSRKATAAAPAASKKIAPAVAPASKAVESAPPAPTEEVSPNEFSFRATGYNATLKKQVVFDGDYIAPTAAPPQPGQDAAAARSRKNQPAARVIGTAKVPGEPAVPVDAVAAE